MTPGLQDNGTTGLQDSRVLSRYFLPYQIEAIMEEARLVLWEKSVRVGATYAMAFRAVRRRVLGLGNYLHTSVNERVAQTFVQDCKKFCKIFDIVAGEVDEFSAYNPLTDRQESAFKIEFPNGKAIKAFSSNPDALRGEGGEVGVDELTSHRDPKEMMKAAGGRAMWGYPVTMWTSHRGEESEFNRLVKEERAKGAASVWKIRSTDLFTAIDQGLLEKINEVRSAECVAAGVAFSPITREAFVAETVAMVGGQEAFEEECLLKPRKGGESAVKWIFLDSARQAYGCARVDLNGDKPGDARILVPQLAALGAGRGRMALGYDVARTGDLSCVWINAEEPRNAHAPLTGTGSQSASATPPGVAARLVGLITMRNMPFGSQRSIIEALMLAFPTLVGAGDSTGLGMQICEELQTKFGPARFSGVNFSAMKPELGTNMVRVYEDGRQILPVAREFDDAIYDVAGIRTQPMPSGRVKFYETPNPISRHSHCDMAWANALALLALKDQVDVGAVAA
jgi:phage FluMu gp28-like protein